MQDVMTRKKLNVFRTPQQLIRHLFDGGVMIQCYAGVPLGPVYFMQNYCLMKLEERTGEITQAHGTTFNSLTLYYASFAKHRIDRRKLPSCETNHPQHSEAASGFPCHAVEG